MEQNDQQMEQEGPKPGIVVGRPAHKHWLVVVLILIILLLLGAAGYLWWQWQESKKSEARAKTQTEQLQDQVSKLKKDAAPSNAATGSNNQQACNDTPSADLKENIKAALDSKNTAAFEGYFSNPVKFVIAASEKGGDETPAQAAVDMDYANTATGPWNFTLPQATLDDYDAGDYTQYFDANTYVGRATTGQVAAFDFDCNGKIKQVFLSASEDLL